MITLHVWSPKPVEAVREGLLPDLGHAAVEFGNVYASFWPEIKSLTGVLIGVFKARTTRNPASYAVETEYALPYMQRAADYSDSADGFDEATMLSRWRELEDQSYDFATRNCSHVVLELLRAGLPEGLREQLGAIDSPTIQVAEDVDPVESALQQARMVVAAPLTSCTPEKVRAMFLAFCALRETGEDCSPGVPVQEGAAQPPLH